MAAEQTTTTMPVFDDPEPSFVDGVPEDAKVAFARIVISPFEVVSGPVKGKMWEEFSGLSSRQVMFKPDDRAYSHIFTPVFPGRLIGTRKDGTIPIYVCYFDEKDEVLFRNIDPTTWLHPGDSIKITWTP